MAVLQQVQDDAAAALKAGDRERAGALRLIISELQKAEKEGGSNEVAVLQRERKRRVEAAEAYEQAGRDDLAADERREMEELIDPYLPAQLADEQLGSLVDEAVAQTGASSPKDMGQVMSAVMPRVAGRADGKRVSALVRERLRA